MIDSAIVAAPLFFIALAIGWAVWRGFMGERL